MGICALSWSRGPSEIHSSAARIAQDAPAGADPTRVRWVHLRTRLRGGRPLSTTVPVIDHKDLLTSAEALGALPATVTRLANIVSNPEHDIKEIVEVVSLDQSLTATLLRR